MFKINDKNEVRRERRGRYRDRMSGTAQRPRLAVYRSLGHIYVQAIDDANGVTLVAASSVDKDLAMTLKSGGLKGGGNVAAAKLVGKTIAERLKEKGLEQVVFDRGGYLYHGRVKALAEAAREAGLKF